MGSVLISALANSLLIGKSIVAKYKGQLLLRYSGQSVSQAGFARQVESVLVSGIGNGKPLANWRLNSSQV